MKLIPLLVIVLIMFVGVCRAQVPNDIYVKATELPKNDIAATYFGMHFHRLVLNKAERGNLTLWPEQLIGSIRLWDSRVRWADITSNPKQWNFDRLDSYVDQATIHHADILYVLGSTPNWASARRDEQCPYGLGCSAEPAIMTYWEDYVRRVVSRYKGKVSTYELWNEPFFSEIKKQKGGSDFYYGSVYKMVEMARIARKILDETDPKAVLTTPGFTGSTNQLELFLSSGGKQYIQVVAYHFYSANTDQFARQLLDVRAVMKRQGLENYPLWNTETGIEVYPSEQPLPNGAQRRSRTEAAFVMSQFLVLGAAAGLDRYYYYAWDNPNSGMFITPPGLRQPTWDAYDKVQTWLINSRMQSCESLPPNGVLCQGDQGGQHFLIVWAESEAIHTISIPSGQYPVLVEKLFSNPPQPISLKERSLSFMLGKEPMRILLKSQH